MAECCKYHAGLLRRRAELKHEVKTDLSGGAIAITHETYDNVWCHFEPVSGSEVYKAMRVDANTKNRMVIRYRDDVRESDIVIIDGRAYGITFIKDVDYMHVWLAIDLDGGAPYVGDE